jgi:hypothetical protein
MLTQVILTHFLAFIISFFPIKVHNMLVVMLDLQFKSIKVVNEFVGNDAMTQGIMKEYDQNIVLTMFLHVYFHLNHVSASISLENHLMIFSLAHFLWTCNFLYLKKTSCNYFCGLGVNFEKYENLHVLGST